MQTTFEHERLDVYRAAVEFVTLIETLIPQFPKGRSDLSEQLQRAAISIVLNIAEGAGEYSPKDKIRFYRMAQRSTTECAAVVDLAQQLKLLRPESLAPGRELLLRIVSMLVAMCRSVGGTGTGSGTGAGSG